MLGVDAGELAGEFAEDVVLAFENDASRAVGACEEPLPDFESCGSQFSGRDGDLVLRADRRRPSSPFLYVAHQCKGNAVRDLAQRQRERPLPFRDAIEVALRPDAH